MAGRAEGWGGNRQGSCPLPAQACCGRRCERAPCPSCPPTCALIHPPSPVPRPQLISEGLKPPILVFVATKERAKELHRCVAVQVPGCGGPKGAPGAAVPRLRMQEEPRGQAA